MGIARSTLYDRSPVETDDTALVEAIAALTGEFEAYGWRRVRAALRQQGIVANHKKIRRIMREHDLQPRLRRRHVVTTDSGHDGPIFPNLARDFEPRGPDQLWLVDITYVAVRGGFAYVAIVLDAWSRRVIGYAIGRSIDVRLTLAPCALPSNADGHHLGAFTMAIVARNTLQGSTASCSPRLASSARWGAAAIPTTTPAPRAS